jgi:hypothetical protein
MSRNSLLVAIGILFVIIVGAISVLALGGGGDDEDGSPADPDATPTLDAGAFGPAPTLGDWVEAIFPVHASAIPQSATRSPNPQDPNGVCIEANFDGLPQNTLWFRMAVDGVEVTAAPGSVWIVPTQVDPEGGRFCWAPEGGLEVGIHDAAVTVQDPNNANAPTRQIVAWKFEVIPD